MISCANFDDVTPVYKPEVRTGSVESEGDGVILGPEFRASQNLDGNGVKIGVISDSVNEVADPANPALVGIAWSQSTGDLPPTVQVLEDDTSANPTDEGRAMLEIVYDVAPEPRWRSTPPTASWTSPTASSPWPPPAAT